MKFNEWVSQEVKSCEAEINDFKNSIGKLQSEVKKEQQQKRDLGQKNNENREEHDQIDEKINLLKSKIEYFKSKINTSKTGLMKIKELSKTKPVRLKTGAVVNSKSIDKMLRKLIGKAWSIEYTQYKDGLLVAYINTRTGSKGSFELYQIKGIPFFVELPIYENGLIKNCSI